MNPLRGLPPLQAIPPLPIPGIQPYQSQYHAGYIPGQRERRRLEAPQQFGIGCSVPFADHPARLLLPVVEVVADQVLAHHLVSMAHLVTVALRLWWQRRFAPAMKGVVLTDEVECERCGCLTTRAKARNCV